jgi:parallel beta-helix repeat protein
MAPGGPATAADVDGCSTFAGFPKAAAKASDGHPMVFVRRAFACALAAIPLWIAPAAHADAQCDRVVSPSGSDSAAGTVAAPYRTLAKLNASLQAGQTGCLRAGTWNEELYVKAAGVTITSYPGERARVVGLTSIGGDRSTVARLDLVGTDVGPLVYGDGATFRGNDVTNNHAGRTCFLIGDAGSRVTGAVIEGNTIHDCGRLPSTNLDHGIYVANSTGARISGNVMFGNADWGIHLYPHADGTLVTHNVIDGNGKGITFSGDDSSHSAGNVVEHNIISNATLQDNLMSYWGSGGTWAGADLGNVARSNCLWGGRNRATGGVNLTYRGFTATDNVVADPLFVDRAAHNYALRADSPCRAVMGDVAAPAPPSANGSPATPPTAAPKAHAQTRKARARAAARKRAAAARKRARARASARKRARARAAQRKHARAGSARRHARLA